MTSSGKRYDFCFYAARKRRLMIKQESIKEEQLIRKLFLTTFNTDLL